MWVDVSAWAERSERQLRRDATTLLAWTEIPHADPLRGVLRRYRVDAAVSLLSAEEASVEQIARAVGYGTSRALSTAFVQSGLDVPARVRMSLKRP